MVALRSGGNNESPATVIPEFDLARLRSGHESSLAALASVARDVGFLTVSGTALSRTAVEAVLDAYRAFFREPPATKASVDMSRTGANRGWGGPRSEQVNPDANPDFKEVFDCGLPLSSDHPLVERSLSVYAPNLWPEAPAGFRAAVETYLTLARTEAMALLSALSRAIGRDAAAWETAFDAPMALLRGNYYPARPDWAGDRDFGIAAHTDYGCLTFLATDGTPGLEVETRDGTWLPVEASPGTFIVNFGEMFEMWTAGQIRATPHRVKGSNAERISVPLFLNPSYDANVAPPGSQEEILAGPYLEKRFRETYVHMQVG